jgi:predicted SprT family Zn-dependent metalloprotease
MDLIEATRLAKGMMADHGLVGWCFEFDNAVKRLGSCRYGEKRITMSRKFVSVAGEAEVRETMLHEIAHALVGYADRGHGAIWKAKYRALGGTGGRTAINPYLASPEVAAATYKWVGTCSAGHYIRRSQRPTRVFSCSKCSGVFSRKNVLSWTYNGQPVEPTTIHPRFTAEWNRIFGDTATARFLAGVETQAAQKEKVAAQAPNVSSTSPSNRPWRPAVGDVVRISVLGYLGRDMVVWKVGPKRAHFQVDSSKVLMVPFEHISPKS